MTDFDRFSIRPLTLVNEIKQVAALQKVIFADQVDSQIAIHSLIHYARNGGQVIGAFEGELLVGYLVAFLGTDSRDPRRPAMANLKLVLEALAVHPDYRSIGLAMRLALALRDWMMQQGIRLVTCAFDPLSSRSAYVLVRKMGMIVPTFLPDYYGYAADSNSSLESTDQMLAEWWVTRNRVEEHLFGRRKALSLKNYLDANVPLINPAILQDASSRVEPSEGSFDFADNVMLMVELPVDFAAIAHQNEALASAWRQHARAVFEAVFRNGYVVTDFLYETYEGQPRAFYLLSYDGPMLTVDLDK